MELALEMTLLLVVFLASLVANGYFVLKYLFPREAKKKNKQVDAVITFLQHQTESTRKMQDSKFLKFADLDRRACMLRLGYLKIEEKALQDSTEARDYYININKNLTRLLAIFLRGAHAGDSSLEDIKRKLKLKADEILDIDSKNALRKEIYAEIHGFVARVNTGELPPALARQLAEKILAKIATFDDMDERVAMKKYLLMANYSRNALQHTDTLLANSEAADEHLHSIQHAVRAHLGDDGDSDAKIQKFIEENATLKQQVDFLRKELQGLRLHSRGGEGVEQHESSFDEFTDISEQILAKNDKEIKKLRTTVRNQKMAIAELEEMLGRMKKSAPGQGESAAAVAIQTEVNKLNRSLQESETCVAMLERELEALKAQMASQAMLKPGQTPDEDMQLLKQSLQHAREELEQKIASQKRQDAELAFAREAIQANSLEDLSFLIYESLANLGCQPSLIIYCKGKNFELGPGGELAIKDKNFINALRVGEVRSTLAPRTVPLNGEATQCARGRVTASPSPSAR